MPGPRDDDRRRSGSGPKRGAQRSDRDRTDRPRRDDGPPPRGPRRPIKGKRRTFDTDSAPNERERARLDRRSDVDGDDAGEGRAAGSGREEWIDEGPVRKAAGDAVRRGSAPKPGERRPNRQRSGSERPAPSRNDKRRKERTTKRAESALELDREKLTRQFGAPRADRTIRRLGEAADAFTDERYEDARKLLKPLAEAVPGEPAIRELYGLTLYRLGRWRLAIAELEEFARRTVSAEQHPVLADCHRAMGQHRRVAELWEELGAASPDAATVAEGRIVYAGSLADQGDLPGAIAVLEAGSLGTKKLKPHHLRMRYALADLYDRAGEHQSARRHFEAVAATDPAFYDVADRLRQL